MYRKMSSAAAATTVGRLFVVCRCQNWQVKKFVCRSSIKTVTAATVCNTLRALQLARVDR
jgi:hypothetical protein